MRVGVNLPYITDQLQPSISFPPINHNLETSPLPIPHSADEMLSLLVLILMGICNNKSRDQENNYSTKALLETEGYNKLNFYFSTENLLRIDADCLVLFCDEKMNLQKNTFVARVGKFETKKIREFADAHLAATKTKIIPGQIVMFPITIPSLRFKMISLVCLKVWDGHEKIRVNLENILTNLFQQIKRSKAQTVTVTQFNQQFGIPIHLGCKLMAEAVFQAKDFLRIVTFICNDSTSQSYYMEKIQKYKGESDEVESKVITASQVSNYY